MNSKSIEQALVSERHANEWHSLYISIGPFQKLVDGFICSSRPTGTEGRPVTTSPVDDSGFGPCLGCTNFRNRILWGPGQP